MKYNSICIILPVFVLYKIGFKVQGARCREILSFKWIYNLRYSFGAFLQYNLAIKNIEGWKSNNNSELRTPNFELPTLGTPSTLGT
jgi:hypothetical protein